MANLLSVVVPSRNEKYLHKTVQDLLDKSKGKIEIIVILDGYWPKVDDISQDDRVNYLHFTKAHGMRAAINAGVDIASGSHILKCDAHCMFKEGFDVELLKNCKKNWVVVPRRYALDPDTWTREKNPKYPVDYMFLDHDLRGAVWSDANKSPELANKKIDDLMTSQGSCWMMAKEYFYELELLDESQYGTFWNEFQEIGLKAWLSGGRVVVNKNTWYAHWHKPSSYGRGYTLSDKDREKARTKVKQWHNTAWHKQTKPLSWLMEKFNAPI